MVARHEGELEKVKDSLERTYAIDVIAIAKDLSHREAPFEVYSEVQSKCINVDILINNAGQALFGKFIETEVERELDMVQLNIGAYVVLSKLFLRDMLIRKQWKNFKCSIDCR